MKSSGTVSPRVTGENVDKAPIGGIKAQNPAGQLVEMVALGVEVMGDGNIEESIRAEHDTAGMELIRGRRPRELGAGVGRQVSLQRPVLGVGQ
ncbi:hypothetical protein D3C78_1667110 [compost metagenome]